MDQQASALRLLTDPEAEAEASLQGQAFALRQVLLFLAPGGIRGSLLKNCSSEVRQFLSKYPRSRNLQAATECLLRDRNSPFLVTQDQKDTTLSIDQAVQDDLRQKLTDKEYSISFQGAVALLASKWHYFESLREHHANDMVSHVRSLMRHFHARKTLNLRAKSLKAFLILVTLTSA